MTPPARSFQDLVVWQKAHAFVLAVYLITEAFRYYFILAGGLGYAGTEGLREAAEEVARLLGGNSRSILSSSS